MQRCPKKIVKHRVARSIEGIETIVLAQNLCMGCFWDGKKWRLVLRCAADNRYAGDAGKGVIVQQ